jgi:2-amino-4-hydroxy-6-hydroxymethyldihydropteridine diphosphokinase
LLVENIQQKAIYIGLGANLDHPKYGSPTATLAAALVELDDRGVKLRRLSAWYRSAPMPLSDQPWYVNAVAEVATDLVPEALLAELHAVEEAFGRVRTVPNAARIIDLDILDFRGEIASGRVVLPHPRMTERAFVLRPLADLAPDWRHPISGQSIQVLLAALPADQRIERL